MALHVKTESVGYRRQSLERSVGLFAGGIRPQQSGFVASQISDHEISKSAIGNWKSQAPGKVSSPQPRVFISCTKKHRGIVMEVRGLRVSAVDGEQ